MLLLVESPSEYAIRKLQQGSAGIDEELDEWLRESQKLLDLFQRNRTASAALFTQDDLRKRPADCLAVLNSCGLDMEKLPEFPATAADPIIVSLANLLSERHVHSGNLYKEILVASSLPRQDDELDAEIKPDLSVLTTYLNKTVNRENKMGKFAIAPNELQSDLELAHLQIHQLQEELETLHLESSRKAEMTAGELSGQKDATEQDLKAELELALLQIHQLQEELELYYQKYLDESAKSKPAVVLDQYGSAGGSESLRVLRIARKMQNSPALG